MASHPFLRRVILKNYKGLRADLVGPAKPEEIRDAKDWLSAHMAGNLSYMETLDQPALTQKFDIAQARQSDSFDKCRREVEKLMQALRLSGKSATPHGI